VYPNPFTNQVTFKVANNTAPVFVDIFDVQGRKVLSTNVNNNESINLEHLNTGLYMYSIIIDGAIIKGKIVKN